MHYKRNKIIALLALMFYVNAMLLTTKPLYNESSVRWWSLL